MLNQLPKRHDLLFLSGAGWERLWEWNENAYPDTASVRGACHAFPELPVITRRWDEGIQRVLIGLSLPLRHEGVRCRMASMVLLEDVASRVTPQQALSHCIVLDHPCGAALRALTPVATEMRLRLGVFGSTALAGVTGYDYLDKDSDLDLVISASEPQNFQKFSRLLSEVEEEFSIQIDAEVFLWGEYFAKLQELIGGQETILVKGGAQPKLLSRQGVWEKLDARG